jgi:hypothetical protein
MYFIVKAEMASWTLVLPPQLNYTRLLGPKFTKELKLLLTTSCGGVFAMKEKVIDTAGASLSRNVYAWNKCILKFVI